jgi:hypothetical protein
MHDTGLSARASSSSAVTAAVDEDDESKTRRALPGHARLRAPHLDAVYLLLLLLSVAVAAFLAGRSRPGVVCAPPLLDARFLSVPDAAAASDFGVLGVPWCKCPRGSCCFLAYRFRSALWPSNSYVPY